MTTDYDVRGDRRSRLSEAIHRTMISSEPRSPRATSGVAASTRLVEDALETLEGCAWVVEKEGRVVGRIDVLYDGPQTARVRWLTIDPAWYRSSTISRLVEMARRYCSEHGPRRLVAEAGSAPGWMLAMLRRRGIPTVRPKLLAELSRSQPDSAWQVPSSHCEGLPEAIEDCAVT
jgi:N-acetylglutamate synthase-like GNAT family acetyltransferase